MTGPRHVHDPQNELPGVQSQVPGWFAPKFPPPNSVFENLPDEEDRGGSSSFRIPDRPSPEKLAAIKEHRTVTQNTEKFNKEQEEQKQRNFKLSIRCFEWVNRIGSGATAGIEDKVAQTDHADPISYDNEEGTVIGGAAGLVMMSLAARAYYKYGKAPEKQPLNPIYRNLKTFYDLGSYVGPFIASFIPASGPQRIISDATCAVAGFFIALITLPFSLLNFNADKIHQYCKTGVEGTSKYLKTSIVIGSDLGGVAAAGMDFAKNSLVNVGIDVIKDGAIGAAITFVTSAILVPLINKLTGNALVTSDGNKFRNNYVRAGISLGIFFGTVIGFVIGTVICPGVGSAAGMAVGAKIGAWISLGSACGGVVGGVTFGAAGNKITTLLNEKGSSQNSWDYNSRTLGYVGAYVGAIIGFFLPIPGGALIGAALGGAVGGLICASAGIGMNKLARKIEPNEPQARLPWTQRVGTGGSIGSVIGAAIGFGVGFAFGGPAGAMLGAVLVGAIGGLIGSAVGWLCDWNARRIAKKSLEKLRRGTPAPPEVAGSLQHQLRNGPSVENVSVPSPQTSPSSPTTPTTASPPLSPIALQPHSSFANISENLLAPPSAEKTTPTKAVKEKTEKVVTNVPQLSPENNATKENGDDAVLATNRYRMFQHVALGDKRMGQPVCRSDYLPVCQM